MNKIVTLQIVLLVGDWATRCFKRPDHKFTKEGMLIYSNFNYFFEAIN